MYTFLSSSKGPTCPSASLCQGRLRWAKLLSCYKVAIRRLQSLMEWHGASLQKYQLWMVFYQQKKKADEVNSYIKKMKHVKVILKDLYMNTPKNETSESHSYKKETSRMDGCCFSWMVSLCTWKWFYQHNMKQVKLIFTENKIHGWMFIFMRGEWIAKVWKLKVLQI